MALWIGAVTLGLAYAFLAWAVFLSLRVLRFADISVDGTFVTGAAVSCVLILKGWTPIAATGAGFASGMACGFVTGLLHTKLGINDLLSGILVMTGVYSVNLRIMGGSNISLSNSPTLLDLPASVGVQVPSDWQPLVSLLAFAVLFRFVIAWFLRTDLGISLRATGDNETMVTSQGVDTHLTKILGLGLSNGLAAASGAMIAQYQGFIDVSNGIGSLVAGIASVILGETIFGKQSVGWLVTAAVIGSIGFRLIVAGALRAGIDPNDLKLLTAAFVLVALMLPLARRRLIARGAGGVA